MHLTPHEIEKLALHTAGSLAQKRLARGLRLNYPESVALISTVLLELIRDGKSSVTDLMTLGQKILGRREVLPAVPEMIDEIHIEGTFPDGTKLVAVRRPISAETGDLQLALYGSFLPLPDPALFTETSPETAGQLTTAPGDITINANRPAITLAVTNTDARPIQVGSHFHFVEANPRLKFDRAQAYGRRLDIAAGLAVRFEPGETKTVDLVEIAGTKTIRGGNNLADGPVSPENKSATLNQIQMRSFSNQQ